MTLIKIPSKPIIVSCVVMLLFGASLSVAATDSADRAVEIATRSRHRVEQNSKSLKVSSEVIFKEFAERTATLQKLLDTRRQLEDSGLLQKEDPDGDARRAHINGKILVEVGELKNVCDTHLDSLLYALASFDEAVAASLVDTQATRSINSNYELSLDQYVKQERRRFEEADRQAQAALMAYQKETDQRRKNRLKKKYARAKSRLLQIRQRRTLYEARIKAASMNQKISALIREKIRTDGSDISTRYRSVLTNLYTTFAKITPIAEVGGTGSPQIMANIGFSNAQELKDTLAIVDGAVEKLAGVLDDMVNDVLAGLGEIRVVKGDGIIKESISIEEEMEFLRKQREAWGG